MFGLFPFGSNYFAQPFEEVSGGPRIWKLARRTLAFSRLAVRSLRFIK